MPRITHFEVHADDLERTMKFYRAVLGWEFKKWEGPADYWMILTGPATEPGINGGLVKRAGQYDGQAANAFVCSMEVTDIDGITAAVQENGGQVATPKTAMPGVGWLGYFKDTEGNMFGVFQSDKSAQ